MKINRTARYVVVKFTPAEAWAFWEMSQFSNRDGDLYDWHKDANATPEELKALKSVMGIAAEAHRISCIPS